MKKCYKTRTSRDVREVFRNMNRRNFLKTAVVGTAAAATAPVWENSLFAAEETAESSKPLDMIAIYGGSPVEMFKKGIAEMGGMERFVKKGQRVILKPNIGWDRGPEFGANTDPDLVGYVTKICLELGAKEVLCFDKTCGNDWQNRYKMSGIKDAVEKNGGKMVDGQSDAMFEEQEIPKGVVLKKADVHKLAINPDVFINMPVLKNHSGTKITCALKNYMGCIRDRQFWHRNNLPQCIADFATYQKTTLTIVDAYRVMLEHGPRGNDPKFTTVAKYQIISTDMVAADVAATQIFATVAKQAKMGKAYTVDEITYLALAEKAGVGTMDLKKINMKRITMA